MHKYYKLIKEKCKTPLHKSQTVKYNENKYYIIYHGSYELTYLNKRIRTMSLYK